MTLLVVLFVLCVVAINVALWKFGFVHLAEKPVPMLDKPTMDAKEQKAILKRLKRWREEGKLSREEYDRFTSLCRSEWDFSG